MSGPSVSGKTDVDVIVVGGGPAGSTGAAMLARAGYSVLLLERDRFPRPHVGESLLPASVPIFEALGVRDEIEAAGFLRKTGAVMVWGSSNEPWRWYFRETNRRYPYSFQVERPQFDQILLENSARLGVDVRQGTRVYEVLFEDGAASGVRFVGDSGRPEQLSARFVLDASGQAGLLGRRLNLRRADSSFRNLAVYGYFSGAEPLPPPDEGNIFIESYEHGWCWGIPLHTGRLSAGTVVDSALGVELHESADLVTFFRAQLAQAPHMTARLRNTTLVDGPYVVRDWSYVSEEVAGDGYVLAGDAACFVDPLFSSGVHLALTSGMLAAAYVNTSLKHPDLGPAAGALYKELYYRQYGHFRELARLFYSSNRSVDSYFWEARRILDLDDSVTPREGFIRAVAGQPVQGYERAVIDRGDAPAELVAGVRAIEAERDTRGARASAALADPATALSLVPVLQAEAHVERRLVLGDGEFVPGDVLVTTSRPEGVPVSTLVARLLGLMDGRRTVDQLLTALSVGARSVSDGRLSAAVLPALKILYVEGAIAELR